MTPNIMERYIGHEPQVVETAASIAQRARHQAVDQKVGQKMAPGAGLPAGASRRRAEPASRPPRLVADADESVPSPRTTCWNATGACRTAHDGGEQSTCRNMALQATMT